MSHFQSAADAFVARIAAEHDDGVSKANNFTTELNAEIIGGLNNALRNYAELAGCIGASLEGGHDIKEGEPSHRIVNFLKQVGKLSGDTLFARAWAADSQVRIALQIPLIEGELLSLMAKDGAAVAPEWPVRCRVGRYEIEIKQPNHDADDSLSLITFQGKTLKNLLDAKLSFLARQVMVEMPRRNIDRSEKPRPA